MKFDCVIQKVNLQVLNAHTKILRKQVKTIPASKAQSLFPTVAKPVTKMTRLERVTKIINTSYK